MDLKAQRAAALKVAQDIIEGARDAKRDITPSEKGTVEAKLDEVRAIDKKIKAAKESEELIQKLAGFEVAEDGGYHGAKTPWGSAVMTQYQAASGAHGVKAFLTGEVRVPPAVDVVALPDVPTSLLDLVARQPLKEGNTFSFLRQVTRTDNAAVVADNAQKPTSVYTFEEVEDRARVVAHLSEPFPLRYLSDYLSMMQVVEVEMRQGVERALEAQLVNGDGTGENFKGILNTTGVTQVAFATDSITTLRKARTALELKGEAVTAVAMHPTDIEALDLLREDGTTGGFLLDTDAYERIFGRGVKGVSSAAVPVGTAIVGNWGALWLRVREDAQTLAATQAGDLFDKNQAKLRTEGRYGIQFIRPQALAVVELTAGD